MKLFVQVLTVALWAVVGYINLKVKEPNRLEYGLAWFAVMIHSVVYIIRTIIA